MIPLLYGKLDAAVARGHASAIHVQAEQRALDPLNSFFDFEVRPSLKWEAGHPLAVIDGPVTPDLYGDLMEWLASTDEAKDRTLHVNSIGGSAITGIAIYNLLNAEDNIDINVTGQAYSAASVLLQGGRKRYVSKGAVVGIHKAMMLAFGNEDDMIGMAEILAEMDSMIMEIYQTRSKADEADIKAAIKKDSRLNGSQAVAMGLADENGLSRDAPGNGVRLPRTAALDDAEDVANDEYMATHASESLLMPISSTRVLYA